MRDGLKQQPGNHPTWTVEGVNCMLSFARPRGSLVSSIRNLSHLNTFSFNKVFYLGWLVSQFGSFFLIYKDGEATDGLVGPILELLVVK